MVKIPKVEISAEGKKVWARNAENIPICGASRGPNKPICGSVVVSENGRCRIHGGNNTKGIAAYNFRTGNNSSIFPKHLRDQAERYAQDPEIISSKNLIALQLARLEELSSRIEGGFDQQTTSNLASRVAEARHLKDDGRESEYDRKVELIFRIIEREREDNAHWTQISQVVENVRKAQETEQKRVVAMQASLSKEELLLMLMQLGPGLRNIILEYCPDRTQRNQILMRMQDLLSRIMGKPMATAATKSTTDVDVETTDIVVA